MSTRKLLATIVFSATGAFANPTHAQTVPYTVTAVADADSQGLGISNTGTVVGRGFTSSSTFEAFFNNGAGPRYFGTLGGTNSSAMGVNDAGEIVGSSDTRGGQTHAFLYQYGNMTDLGTFGGYNSSATAIAGITIVGSALRPPPADPNAFNGPRAFVFSQGGQLPGQMQDIGTLPFPSPFAIANAINNRGQIVGSSGQFGPGDPPEHPFLYANGVMTDLGTLGGNSSAALGINDLGQVVGYSNIPTGLHVSHAFLYSNGVLSDLEGQVGAGVSIANDINNRGEIVGESDGLGAFILRGGVAASLNALVDPATGWQILDASAINERGQIAATGVLDGTQYAVLLTPVPEPATVGMLAFGLGVLTLSRAGRSRRSAPGRTDPSPRKVDSFSVSHSSDFGS